MHKFVAAAAVIVAMLCLPGAAEAETSDNANPSACFGEFASTFAITVPKSGQEVSDIATSQPQAIGCFSSATATTCPRP